MNQARDDDPIPATADPGELTRAMFEDRVGDSFTMRGADQAELELVLEAVTATRHAGDRPGGGFHLVFSGPQDPHFLQGNIILTLPDGRDAVLFAVNNGPQDGRMRYQIVLS